jgi:FkbM family methyltransferase
MSLKRDLNTELRACQSNWFTDNEDSRFGAADAANKRNRGLVRTIRDEIRARLIPFGFHKLSSRQKHVWRALDEIDWLYERLDAQSKRVLVEVLSFRILGKMHVKLPLNTNHYWETFDDLDERAKHAETLVTSQTSAPQYRYSLQDYSYPIDIFARPSCIYATMILQQYRCETRHGVIEAEPGDVVIDAGACNGDTALYFAYKTGATGKIYAWEFFKENIAVLEKNLALNPELATSISLISEPMWSSSGEEVYVTGAGASTTVSRTKPKGSDAVTYTTRSIDDFALDQGLDQLDFIKMDIEGAELEALQGAESTIRKHKPKLAISIYHDVSHFFQIPRWIDSLDLGYVFHVRHFTIHDCETMLFATVKAPSQK